MKNCKIISAIFVLVLAVILLTQISSSFGMGPQNPKPTPTPTPTPSEATQILAYYSGSKTVGGNAMGTGDPRSVSGTQILADKPVLFTVSIDIRDLDLTEEVFIGSVLGTTWGQSLDDFMLYKFVSATAGDGPNVFETITFPSTNMTIGYASGTSDNIYLKWNIMVQGSPGTIVSVVG